jgi:hypothetical protein
MYRVTVTCGLENVSFVFYDPFVETISTLVVFQRSYGEIARGIVSLKTFEFYDNLVPDEQL